MINWPFNFFNFLKLYHFSAFYQNFLRLLSFYLRVCILINIQTEDKFCGYGESGTGIFGYQPLKNSSY